MANRCPWRRVLTRKKCYGVARCTRDSTVFFVNVHHANHRGKGAEL